MKQTDRQVARMLLEIGAVRFSAREPFTYTSGMVSPVYCDIRQIISYPYERDFIVGALIDLMREKIGLDEIDAVSGTATAGIPLASWIADRLHMPMVYVRDNSKKHGLKTKIEGKTHKGSRMLVVEDIVSSGKSSANNIESLREAETEVNHCIAVASYDMAQALETYKKLKVQFTRLVSMGNVIEVAVENGVISKKDAAVIKEWQKDPWGWGKGRG